MYKTLYAEDTLLLIQIAFTLRDQKDSVSASMLASYADGIRNTSLIVLLGGGGYRIPGIIFNRSHP